MKANAAAIDFMDEAAGLSSDIVSPQTKYEKEMPETG